MSRSRLSRCLLLAVMLAALAPAGASAQPLAPPSLPCSPTCSTAPAATAPARPCLPTCGSDVYMASRQNRPHHTAAVALAAHPANQPSDAGLAAHRLDLSDQVATTVVSSDAGLAAHRLDLSDQAAATTVRSSDAGLAAHRLDLSEPTAAATARPACLPTCGSASVAPRVTPVGPSSFAKAEALKRHRSAPASTPASATQTSTPDSSNSGILVRDAAILGLLLLVAGIVIATRRHRLRPLGSQPR